MRGAPWPRIEGVNQKPWRPRAKATGATRKRVKPRPSWEEFLLGGISSPEPRLQLLPGKAVQNGSFFKTCTARLIDSTPNERQLTGAMSIGVDGDHHPRGVCFSRVLGGEVEPVRAGVDLEKAAIL